MNLAGPTTWLKPKLVAEVKFAEWLLRTHQGAVSGRHLDYYLDEHTFRFNRRASRSRGLLFYRLMQQAVVTTPVSYRQIVNSPDHNVL